MVYTGIIYIKFKISGTISIISLSNYGKKGGAEVELKNILSFGNSEKSIGKAIKKNGINEVFKFMDNNKTYFYKIAWAYVQNHDDIEDIFENTIIHAYMHIKDLKNEHFFKTWITSILINECRKVLKDKKRIETRENLEMKKVFDEKNYNTDYSIDLILALRGLESIFKEPIILKYFGGYSQEEIAKLLNIPLGTVKSRIYRGIKLLKKYLIKEEV